MVKRQILSTGLALLLASSLPFTALADTTDSTISIRDGSQHTIGSIDYTDNGYALDVRGDGTDVTVDGAIKSDNGYGIAAGGDSTTTVKGDLSADRVAINAGGEADVTVAGDVRGTGSTNNTIEVGGKTDITIKGDVIAEDTSAIRTDQEANVKVDGSIKAGNGGISAWGYGEEGKENTTVTVGKDVTGSRSGIDAMNGADVTVGGDVVSGGSGVYSAVFDNVKDTDITNTILIGGDVNVTTKDGHYDYMGVGAYSNSTINIVGTVTVKDDAGKDPWAIWSQDSQVTAGAVDSDAGGIQAGGYDGKADGIHIAGDLEAGDGYYTIQLWGSDATTVLVGNDVKSKNNGDILIDVAQSSNENSEIAIGGTIKNADSDLKLKVEVDSEGNAINLPEIVVGEIENIEQLTVVNNEWDKLSEEASKQVLDSIKYVVSSNPDSMEGKGSFQITKLDGSALSRDKSGSYDVAGTYETITVHVDVQTGYEVASLTAGNSPVVKNADGSYSITVQPGGGVNIEALIRAIENNVIPGDTSDDTPSHNPSGNMSGNYNDSDSDSTDFSVWNLEQGNRWAYTNAYGSKVRGKWMLLDWNGRKDWYFFDSDSFMKAGWHQDADGHWYYLNPVSDGFRGAMQTGWQNIDGIWYFLNDGSYPELPKGCLVEQAVR